MTNAVLIWFCVFRPKLSRYLLLSWSTFSGINEAK